MKYKSKKTFILSWCSTQQWEGGIAHRKLHMCCFLCWIRFLSSHQMHFYKVAAVFKFSPDIYWWFCRAWCCSIFTGRDNFSQHADWPAFCWGNVSGRWCPWSPTLVIYIVTIFPSTLLPFPLSRNINDLKSLITNSNIKSNLLFY